LESALTSCQQELKEEKAKLAELKEHFKYNLKLINDRDAELQRYDALFLGKFLSTTSTVKLLSHIIHKTCCLHLLLLCTVLNLLQKFGFYVVSLSLP